MKIISKISSVYTLLEARKYIEYRYLLSW
jgi:hypothetical protein